MSGSAIGDIRGRSDLLVELIDLIAADLEKLADQPRAHRIPRRLYRPRPGFTRRPGTACGPRASDTDRRAAWKSRDDVVRVSGGTRDGLELAPDRWTGNPPFLRGGHWQVADRKRLQRGRRAVRGSASRLASRFSAQDAAKFFRRRLLFLPCRHPAGRSSRRSKRRSSSCMVTRRWPCPIPCQIGSTSTPAPISRAG